MMILGVSSKHRSISKVMGFPHSSTGKESACDAGDSYLTPELGRSPGEGIGHPTPVFLSSPGGSAGKESTHSDGDLGSIPGLGRCPGEGKGYPLQYSGLEKSMDCRVHGEAELDTTERLFTFTVTLQSQSCCVGRMLADKNMSHIQVICPARQL